MQATQRQQHVIHHSLQDHFTQYSGRKRKEAYSSSQYLFETDAVRPEVNQDTGYEKRYNIRWLRSGESLSQLQRNLIEQLLQLKGNEDERIKIGNCFLWKLIRFFIF